MSEETLQSKLSPESTIDAFVLKCLGDLDRAPAGLATQWNDWRRTLLGTTAEGVLDHGHVSRVGRIAE